MLISSGFTVTGNLGGTKFHELCVQASEGVVCLLSIAVWQAATVGKESFRISEA